MRGEARRSIARLCGLLVFVAGAVVLTAPVFPSAPDTPCEQFGVEPDPETHCVAFTNDTDEAAGFLHVHALVSTGPNWTPIEVPAACGEPIHWFGFEYHELVWPAPCIDPGETVVFEFSINRKPFSPYFAPDPPVVVAVNDSDRPARALILGGAARKGKGINLIQNAPGCGQPTISFTRDGVEFLWDTDCVDPGEKVSVHVPDSRPVTSAPYTWLFAIIFGDASCNETVDAIDALLVLQYDSGLVEALSCAEEADVNKDGQVDSLDAVLILQLRAGLVDSLPA